MANRINIGLRDELLNAIEDVRGLQSLQEWIRLAIIEKLQRDKRQGRESER